MKIEEAIAQLKDLRKDREGFLENDEPDSEFAKDIEAIDVALEHMDLHGTYIGMSAHNELSAKYEKQKSINYELVEENQEFVNENKELKRLLRLAVGDIERFRTLMSHCVHKDFYAAALEYNCNPYDLCNSCPLSGSEKCRWQHAEEALGLIGDDKQ